MKASPWCDIIKIQKQLYRLNQRFIDKTVSVKEPSFDRYRKAYVRATSKYQRISSNEEMMESVIGADIIIVGDYHTCLQSQRSFLRILKQVIQKDQRFCVGLELLNKMHQAVLDKFCTRKISEETFLKRVKLEEHWVFDLWPNFKPIFDFCRYHNISIYAIDAARPNSSVWVRDVAAGELAAEVFLKENKKLFILIGDLHLAPSHLPAAIEKALKKRGAEAKLLILYENCDNIYWDLASKGLAAEVDVVKIDERSYCRLHTPPVVCQQSYINWLENEEAEIDFADAKHSFMQMVDTLCTFLSIKIDREKHDVEVYTCGDLSFLSKIEQDERFSSRELKIIKQQILASESYFIAKAGIVYLGKLSVNHTAEEAAHYLKHICSGYEQPRSVVDAYYANVLHEMLGFFGSKVINHKRKCDHWTSVEATLTYLSGIKVPPSRRLEYEVFKLALEVRELERKGRPLRETMIQGRYDILFALSHLIGYMLGDKLYYALLKGIVTRREVKQMFYDRWDGVGTPFAVYYRFLKRLKSVRIPERM